VGVRGGFGDGEGGGLNRRGRQVIAIQTLCHAHNPFGLSLSKAFPAIVVAARDGFDRLSPNGSVGVMAVSFSIVDA
jgi:hypothetical protein